MVPKYTVVTVAGVTPAFGFVDGQGSVARFKDPQHLCIDASGRVYVTDYGNLNALRRMTSSGLVSTLVLSLGTALGPLYSVAVDAAGNFYTTFHTKNMMRIYNVTTASLLTVMRGAEELKAEGTQ